MDEKSIVPLKAQVTKIEKSVSDLVIKTSEDMVIATDVLGSVKKYLKSVTDKKEEITSPLNAALKAARALFSPLEEKAKSLETEIKSKMVEYQKKQIAITDVKIAKVEQKIEDGKLSLDKGSKKIENLVPETKVSAVKSAVTFREDKKLKIVDEKLIPREYLIVNEVLLRKDVLAGKIIPGAEIEIVLTPVSTKI